MNSLLLALAVLQSASGQMTLTETRCAPEARAADCGHVKLTNSFSAGPRAATKKTAGVAGFRNGVLIGGRGRGDCSADSPPTIVTAPDGSMQILSGAVRVEPARTKGSAIAIATTSRGARWAWLEPVDPSFTCTYFGQSGTALAVPSNTGVPRSVTSRVISARVLRRARFTVRIAGTQKWESPETDGTKVTGTGSWELTLKYARPSARRAPSFVSRR